MGIKLTNTKTIPENKYIFFVFRYDFTPLTILNKKNIKKEMYPNNPVSLNISKCN